MEFLQSQKIASVMVAGSSHWCQAFYYLFYFSLFVHNMTLGIFLQFI